MPVIEVNRMAGQSWLLAGTGERVAVVVFGLNLTLAALMLYLMLRHAGREPDVAADDLAEEELQAFASQRRSAALLQAGATIVGSSCRCSPWSSTWHWRSSTSSIRSGSCAPARAAERR